jgi:hypothetical protein
MEPNWFKHKTDEEYFNYLFNIIKEKFKHKQIAEVEYTLEEEIEYIAERGYN